MKKSVLLLWALAGRLALSPCYADNPVSTPAQATPPPGGSLPATPRTVAPATPGDRVALNPQPLPPGPPDRRHKSKKTEAAKPSH